MKKVLGKFFILLMSIAMMVGYIGGLPLMANALSSDSWADVENRDTTWVDGAISTPQQLAQFAYLVNTASYAGKNKVWLNNDINLAGKEWTPIGNENDDDKIYKGVFNGNGFTVSNMSITYFTGTKNIGLYGLFGLLEGTIKNTNVSGNINCSETYDYYCFIGGLTGYSDFGSIVNCVSTVNITITATTLSASDIGGIVGSNYGEVIGCTNKGNIYMVKGNSSPIGGIAGLSAGIIDRCENQGELESYTTYIGGIVGYKYMESGYYDNPWITNSFNSGNIIDIAGRNFLYYGGIAGYAGNDVLVENCYSVGSVPQNVTWGNLVGEIRVDTLINNCFFIENGSFGIGKVGSIFVTGPADDQGTVSSDEEMKTKDFVEQLNGTGNAFVFNPFGYPILGLPLLPITIEVSPTSAVVLVQQGDREIAPETDGSYLLVPDDYTVIVTATNYKTKTENFTVTLHQDTHIINIHLDILPADYTKVEEAIAKIPTDLSIYTEASVKAVTDARNAVVLGKDITEQEIVDAYARAIEDAIKGLVKRTITPTNPSTPKPTDSIQPNTGDTSQISLWSTLVIGSISIIVIPALKRKKETIQ